MKPTALKDIDESLIEFNRARYMSELSQGVFDLMQSQGISRTRLANLLGVNKTRISHILSGTRNLGAETLADVFLVLGRTPHLVLGTDFEAIRFPVDEDETPIFVQGCYITSISSKEELESVKYKKRSKRRNS